MFVETGRLAESFVADAASVRLMFLMYMKYVNTETISLLKRSDITTPSLIGLMQIMRSICSPVTISLLQEIGRDSFRVVRQC